MIGHGANLRAGSHVRNDMIHTKMDNSVGRLRSLPAYSTWPVASPSMARSGDGTKGAGF